MFWIAVVIGAGAGVVFAGTISRPVNNIGLVGYWSFDVGKGGITAYDMTGNGSNGTLTSMNTDAVWMDGKIHTALSFDGIDDVVNVGSAAILDNIRTITVCTWANWDGGGDDGRMYFKATDASQNNALGLILSTNEVGSDDYFEFRYPFTTNGRWQYRGETVQTSRWYHVCTTYDGSSASNPDPIMYIDGTPVTLTEVSTPAGASADDSAFDATIGNRTNQNQPFSGLLDDVRIYNRILSFGEIRRLYNLGRVAAPTTIGVASGTTTVQTARNQLTGGLLGYWSFDGDVTGAAYTADTAGRNSSAGILNGGMDQTSVAIGRIGQGLSFDGVDDYISVADVSTTTPKVESYVIYESTDEPEISVHTIGAPAGVEEGDLLVQAWMVRSHGGFNRAFDTGWAERVFVNDQPDNGEYIAVGTKRATASEPATYDFDSSAARDAVGFILRISDDAAAANPIHVSNTTDESGFGEIHTAPSVTTTANNTLVFYSVADSSGAAWTEDTDYPSGTMLVGVRSSDSGDGTDTLGGLVYKEQAATGASGTGTFESNDGTFVSSVLATFAIAPTTTPRTVNTISFWMKADDTTSRKIINIDGTDQIELDASGNVTATSFPGATVYVDGSLLSANVATSTWHHVAIVDLVGVSPTSFEIGRVGSDYFDGVLDEVRVYNRELSENEIKRLYNMGR